MLWMQARDTEVDENNFDEFEWHCHAYDHYYIRHRGLSTTSDLPCH